MAPTHEARLAGPGGGRPVRPAPGHLVLAHGAPLVFGFVPIGLAYHAAFSIAAAVLLGLLVTYAWPSHLEDEVDRE